MSVRSGAAGRQPTADSGAVAILTAMLALVLFGFAALAIELGDLYSRDAAVQTTADLAAFAGAQELPNPCGAFDKAHEYLTNDTNGVYSDTAPTTFSASAGDLTDGDDTNGEIEILDWDNKPLPNPTALCSRVGHRVRVTTPRRTISFPLAGGLPGAPDSGTVQATAGVEVRSLDHLDVLPLSLPASCGFGSQTIYAKTGASPPPSGTPNFQPPGNRRGPWVTLVDPPSEQLPGLVTTINVSLSRLRADPDPDPVDPPAPPVEFDFTLSGGTPVQADGTWDGGPVTPTVGHPTWFDASFDVPVPAVVQTTPGEWNIRARQLTPGSNRFTPNPHVGLFTVKPEVLTKCIPTPDPPSGLLTSPRAGGGDEETMLANNLRLGIDHDLFPVVNPGRGVPCDADGAPDPDSRLDDGTSPDGATCVNVRTSTVAAPTDGLIGSGTQTGRLVGTPAVLPSGSCGVSGDPDLRWRKNGFDLVDTALSCYLKPTMGLGNVKNGDADSLTQAIVDDPRFFVMPTTNTYDYLSNLTGPRWWPIKDLVGAFLTNETTSSPASCQSDESSNCNGLVFNGSNLTKVQAFTFPLSAIEEIPGQAHPDNGRAYIGGPRDTLLVE